MGEHDEPARRDRRSGPGRAAASDGPAPDAGLLPDYEEVPAWALVAIVIGLTLLSGSLVVVVLTLTLVMLWIFVGEEPPKVPKRRSRKG
jgi:hypothetical protein